MPDIPRDRWPESSLPFLLDPYRYISKTCAQLGSDIFEARLLLRRTTCMMGHEAAALFYDESRFARAGVAPGWLQKTLFGEGGVQGLDGAGHRHRKQMFVSLMTPDSVRRLGDITAVLLDTYARKWTGMERIVLYDEMNEILTRGVCEWAGVPLPHEEIARRTGQLTAMFDRAGAVSPAHLWARLARRGAERWIGDLIEQIRAGTLEVPETSAARVVATHRDLEGRPLDRHTAAVELINVLRPTVAVSVFITFAALALYEHPDWRRRLNMGDEGATELFAQEVRRLYPFFPVVMARVRRQFEWKGFAFQRGRRVLLDLYGTNHDDRIWDKPDEFNPDRFRDWDGSAFNLIPQGGGDAREGHRCPGEAIALTLIRVASQFFVSKIAYVVPQQYLSVRFSRLPALPKSRFIITNVQLVS